MCNFGNAACEVSAHQCCWISSTAARQSASCRCVHSCLCSRSCSCCSQRDKVECVDRCSTVRLPPLFGRSADSAAAILLQPLADLRPVEVEQIALAAAASRPAG